MASSSGDELLRAEAELWCHAFGYLKSTALQCAIKLGIPNAVYRCGGAASLSELHAAVPVTASKRACLSRLMRFLAVSGVFREEAADRDEAAGSRYSLTPVSRLLVTTPDGGNGDDRSGHHACLSQLILLTNSPFHLKSSQCLAEWLQKEDDGAEAEMPLAMAYGGSFYSVLGTDVEYGQFFNEAMASDSRFVAEVVVRDRECREVFTGVTSLVDVGGGDGTTARAIAKAFPQISRCSVLELPHVVDAAPADDDCAVEFIAGDMMEFIPPADVLLLKWIMHNWSDEDCVRILKRCKEAVSTREPKGKVVIIDVVVGSQPKQQMLEAQLVSDLCMMLLTTGEERDTEKWQRIFQDAGFTQYKISPVLGFRSLIELYP